MPGRTGTGCRDRLPERGCLAQVFADARRPVPAVQQAGEAVHAARKGLGDGAADHRQDHAATGYGVLAHSGSPLPLARGA